MLRLHDYGPSGNCYKVRLLLAALEIPYERVPIDLKDDPAKQAYRARFRLGRVPVLELDDGKELAESNAILCYLAEGTPYLPNDRWERAQVLKWLFWEQYDHEPYIAVIRAWRAYFGIPKGREAEVPLRKARAYEALGVLEDELTHKIFLASDRYSIADMSLFAYSHVAHEGGFELSRFPALCRWIARIQAQPKHVRISD